MSKFSIYTLKNFFLEAILDQRISHYKHGIMKLNVLWVSQAVVAQTITRHCLPDSWTHLSE